MRTLSIAVALLILAAPSPAPASDGGSAYSLLGIGDIRPGVSPVGLSMGNTGIGVPYSSDINWITPAGWFGITRVRFDASALYEGFNSTDGLASRYLAKMDFNGGMLAIPISEAHGITFGAGFVPFSKVNYDLYTGGSFLGSVDTLQYQLHHTGTGGVSKAFGGLSYQPVRDLALGAAVNYLFGTIDNTRSVNPLTTGYAGGSATESTSLNGATVTAAAMVTGFGFIADALRPLSFGIMVTSRGTLPSKSVHTYKFTAETDTSTETQGQVVIPVSFGIGASYRPSARTLLAVDYFSQAWSQSTIDGSVPYGIRDSHRFGIGAERLPSPDAQASYLDRLAYRLGFAYDATYYDLNGQAINSWYATAGLGLPMSGETRLNLAFQYGSRGTTTGGLVLDHIFRLTVSLSISEHWFIQYPEE